MSDNDFSFVELERRLREIPEGPVGVLNTPRWIIALNVLGWFGIVLGLAPSLLVKFLSPESWMAWMSSAGLLMAILGFAPGFVRNVFLVVISFYRWRMDLVRQMDHDLIEYRDLRRWLAQFPVEACSEAIRFVRQGQERVAAKQRLIVGSLEKLGVLPVVAALFIQVKTYYEQLGETPVWQVVLAIFLAVIYLIGWLASLVRLRLHLYEIVLADSLASQGVEPGRLT